MNWLEKQTEMGVLKYRMPNVLEAYDILEDSGFSGGERSPVKLKRNVIALLKGFVNFEGMSGIESFDDLLNHVDVMAIPLSEIADEIMTKSFAAFKKKSS